MKTELQDILEDIQCDTCEREGERCTNCVLYYYNQIRGRYLCWTPSASFIDDIIAAVSDSTDYDAEDE